MLNRTDLRDQFPSAFELRTVLPRAQVDVDSVIPRVRPILDEVRERGVAAVFDYTERFDGVRPKQIRVSSTHLTKALASLDPEVRVALEETITRTRAVHTDQRRSDVTTTLADGATVTERWLPVERVGLYAPGGLAVYPSTVIMNVVPAQIAGASSLVLCSPPQAEWDGLPHPTILAAAALLDIDEVWAVGGAQAMALLAYGGRDSDDTPLWPVDMVTGPGNIYVTAAKRLLRGYIGIDSEAGPTEIAILADETADPEHVAADLISQAEHDPLAASVLITNSEHLADAVDDALIRRTAVTKHRERVEKALRGQQSGTILTSTVDEAIAVTNAYAAEHVEIHTVDASVVAHHIRHAGAVFVGAYSPVSLGDYCAGSNHVLPTGGYARHSSGLSVQSFLRGIHVVDYDASALKAVAANVVALANAENLPAHGEAITARFPEGG